MLDACRPAGFDLGPALDDRVGVAALDVVVEATVAVEVVEVLEQGKVQRLLHVGIRLVLRQVRGEVDRDLLVAERGLDDRLVRRVEPVDRLLLLGVDPPHQAIDFFTPGGSGCIRSIACDIRTALFSIPFMRMIRVRV